MATGIEVRHARACRSRSGARCNCEPTYRASVWSKGETVRIYVKNGGKDMGSLTVESDGSIGETYAKLGRFGWELLEAAKKEVGL